MGNIVLAFLIKKPQSIRLKIPHHIFSNKNLKTKKILIKVNSIRRLIYLKDRKLTDANWNIVLCTILAMIDNFSR